MWSYIDVSMTYVRNSHHRVQKNNTRMRVQQMSG